MVHKRVLALHAGDDAPCVGIDSRLTALNNRTIQKEGDCNTMISMMWCYDQ